METRKVIDNSINQKSKLPEKLNPDDLKLSRKDFFIIGRPCGFTPDVDPQNNIKNYMLRKMNVIDLIPCTYQIKFSKIQQDIKQNNVAAASFVPKVYYDEAIARFNKLATLYDLKPVKAVRLFITDETQNADQFENIYSANIFQRVIDTLSEKGQEIKDALKYFQHDLDWNKFFASKKLDEAKNKLNKFFTETLGFKKESVDSAGNITQALGNIILRGTRVSFPRVWSRSEYRPNLVANIKLVSPYGDRSAIKEFIIKPLMYLLLLSSPVTEDGLSYGYPPAVTVRAYGLSMMTIATINSISLRRGGNDTAFNVYRQPLQIDVSVSFENLVSGFGVVESKETFSKGESTFKDADRFIETKIEPTEQPLMTTLGKIIDSLRPFSHDGVVMDTFSLDSSLSTGIEKEAKVIRDAIKERGGKILV